MLDSPNPPLCPPRLASEAPQPSVAPVAVHVKGRGKHGPRFPALASTHSRQPPERLARALRRPNFGHRCAPTRRSTISSGWRASLRRAPSFDVDAQRGAHHKTGMRGWNRATGRPTLPKHKVSSLPTAGVTAWNGSPTHPFPAGAGSCASASASAATRVTAAAPPSAVRWPPWPTAVEGRAAASSRLWSEVPPWDPAPPVSPFRIHLLCGSTGAARV